ncbi:tetratricopeptide repeat protein [Nocardia sp. NBC_01377]
MTAMTTLLRTIMADRRLLLIFDNARSADQVRPMLFEISGCFTIVTSRNRMDGLVVTEGAHRLVVGLPADRDATNILLTRLREESPSARSDPAVAELTTLCARLPLALSIVAADFPERSIAERVAELRAEQSRLDLLGVDGADGDLRTVLSWSHRSLPEPAARLFRLIGAHPGPDIDPEACAALLGDDEDARRLLRVLTHSNLLTEHRGRFAAHDLLRLYAQELSRAEPAERSAAATRLLDHYLRATTAANLGIQPCRAHELPLMEPASEFVPDRSYTESMEWFGREWRSLLALVEMAAAEGFPAYAWRLAVLCTTYLRRSGRRRERREIHRHAVAAAAACHDPVAHATTLRLLGDATARLDEHGTAIELLTLSMREFEVLDDPDGVRQAHLSLCRVYESLGAYETALAHAETALTSAVPEDGVLAYADYLNATARLNARCGNHRKAVTMATETLAYYRELGYEEGSADILLTLGAAESWLGSFEVALEHVEISLSVDRELGDHYRAALATEQLGDIHDRRGTSHRAVEYWENALAMFDDLRHPDRARVAAKLDGQDASRGRLHRGVSE